MWDDKTKMMLEAANELTAEDLELIKGQKSAPAMQAVVATPLPVPMKETQARARSGLTMGERERARTRESKVSTACVGQPRTGHNWWPVGTDLEGRVGTERFAAQVVQNSRVKSGRGLLITSGPAMGRVCNTPTRAALEATESYRQASGLGRCGGVTNGWTFWKPVQ